MRHFLYTILLQSPFVLQGDVQEVVLWAAEASFSVPGQPPAVGFQLYSHLLREEKRASSVPSPPQVAQLSYLLVIQLW